MITNQDVRTNIDFINPFVKHEIEKFAREEFFSTYGDRWEETIPTITLNVKNYAQVLFDRLLSEKAIIGRVRGRSDYTCIAYSKPERLKASSMNLMATVLESALGIHVNTVRGKPATQYHKSKNERKESMRRDPIVSTSSGLHPDLSLCQFHCSWLPDNEYLDLNSKKRKRDQSLPNTRKQASIPYKLALESEEPDVTFISAKDQGRLPAHFFVLKLHEEKNNYFTKLFEGSFREAKTKEVSLECGTIALTSLVKFIYEGEVDAPILSDLMSLTELLKISHQIEEKELFNHSIDLIHAYLEKSKLLDKREIESLISLGFIYDRPDFFGPSLKNAEYLATKDCLIDWLSINKTFLPGLLVVAAELRLPKIQKSIILALQSHLAQSVAPVLLLSGEGKIN